MLLSQYCQTVKPYVEQSLDQLNKQGQIEAYFNDTNYTVCVDFLDACVLSLCEHIMKLELEKDIDLSEAFRQSGILQGYLDNTDILGKVAKDQNPLRGIFK